MQSFRVGPRNWYLIDAKSTVLGRLASSCISVLTGKHKPMFRKDMDFGDNVIIINSKEIALTGKKWRGKLYYRHTLRPRGFKIKTAEMIHRQDETELLRKAINGMLPKNSQRKRRMARVHIYPGAQHPFENLKPIPYEPLGKDALYKELRF